jgi:hypothetical protein
LIQDKVRAQDISKTFCRIELGRFVELLAFWREETLSTMANGATMRLLPPAAPLGIAISALTKHSIRRKEPASDQDR